MACFGALLDVARTLIRNDLERIGEPRFNANYRQICRWIRAAAEEGPPRTRTSSAHPRERDKVAALFIRLKQRSPGDWLQRLASLLAMLMHFRVDTRRPGLLVNHRRPGRLCSTYPNSAQLCRLVGSEVLARLVCEPAPTTGRRARDADRYADRAFHVRILDPSMESGQLLLGIAQAALRHVQGARKAATQDTRRLAAAALEKLCSDVLWGIDANGLAEDTFSLIMFLLGWELSIPKLSVRCCRTGNSLELFRRGELSGFDAIVNNPPWGTSMTPAQRQGLREHFTTVNHRPDMYIPFAEMAFGCLRPGGTFAWILPAQAVAARNAAKLRSMLSRQSTLRRLIVLPKTAFAEATVRGAVLIGHEGTPGRTAVCRVEVYPLRLHASSKPHCMALPCEQLARREGLSWWPLITVDGPSAAAWREETVRLERVADVVTGVQLYRLNKGIPRQTADIVRRKPFSFSTPRRGTVPALRGADILQLRVRDPSVHVKLGRWLSWVGDHQSLRAVDRVFAREICRRDGTLFAAVAEDGYLPLHSVLTLVPRLIDPRVLVGILNSALIAGVVRGSAASMCKVAFQRVTATELRRMPIAVTALSSDVRRTLGLAPPTARQSARRRAVVAIVAKAMKLPAHTRAGAGILKELNAAVEALYAEA